MAPFMEGLHGFYPDQWLLDDNNYALTNGEDYCLFEMASPGVHYGHYFCKSRGKKALEFSKECVAYMFNNATHTIQGLTPAENRAARWMARQVGLKSYGVIETSNGPHELFILTKKEWETS